MTTSPNFIPSVVTPRIIIHGGAGNVSRKNLPRASYDAYSRALLAAIRAANKLLAAGATALDAATYAVSLLEDNPLFNASKGAVFTRAGTIELEASVMVSRGKRKRGCGVMLVKRVKNPILLAKEMLVRGEEDNGGGAQFHCQLSGKEVERLAEQWGCEMVEPEYFYTKRRWKQHERGLRRERGMQNVSGFEIDEKVHNTEAIAEDYPDLEEYLPQGTVGCVALDQWGTLCVATSTGGLTNKLPGRIGDTPTLGAGFWAEEWIDKSQRALYHRPQSPPLYKRLLPVHLTIALRDCLPMLFPYEPLVQYPSETLKQSSARTRAVAMSGTGNGDSFLRLTAARTAAAITRFSTPTVPLSVAVTQIVGTGGEMQRSAGDRWGKTGEGEGGFIGIEFADGTGRIVQDFNCGGMFRAWIDDEGRERMMIFKGDY